MKDIYTIYTCEKLEKGENGLVQVGSSRTPGWYSTFEEAERTVLENACDIWETCFNYACIEKYHEGLYGIAEEMGWYKYDPESRGYRKIERPAVLKGLSSFGMG